jgi:hypothetical protein
LFHSEEATMPELPEQRRPIDDILADIDALPLTRSPSEQMSRLKDLNELMMEAGFDAGPGSRDEELRRHPDTSRVLLAVIDRMLPVFDDPEFTWSNQDETSPRFPGDYYQVDDLLSFLLGEYLHGLPGYAEELVELVRRHPQAWSVRLLIDLARRTTAGRVGDTDLFDMIEGLKQLEYPQAAARVAREFRRRRGPT